MAKAPARLAKRGTASSRFVAKDEFVKFWGVAKTAAMVEKDGWEPQDMIRCRNKEMLTFRSMVEKVSLSMIHPHTSEMRDAGGTLVRAAIT
jgi:hypothetical protein